MHYPSILALVLKVLAPLLSYYAVYRSERKKQQRDVLGYPDPYKAKSVISYSDDLTRALEDTWIERGDQYHPRCDEPTLDKFLAVAVSHPSFPFTYYALSVRAFEAGKDTWHHYADQALGILERTTQFVPPHRQHVQAYERLRARLEQQ